MKTRVVLAAPGEEPLAVEVENDFGTFRNLLRGYTEMIATPFRRVYIAVKEDMELRQYAPNFWLGDTLIRGECIFFSIEETIREKQVLKIMGKIKEGRNGRSFEEKRKNDETYLSCSSRT